MRTLRDLIQALRELAAAVQSLADAVRGRGTVTPAGSGGPGEEKPN